MNRESFCEYARLVSFYPKERGNEKELRNPSAKQTNDNGRAARLGWRGAGGGGCY